MNNKETHVLVEHVEEWSFADLCQRQLMDESFIIACVECGVIETESARPELPTPQWRFPPDAVLRIQRARRLQRDLDLEVNDMPLVLDLLEEVEHLRREVDVLRTRLRHWELED